MSERAGFVGHPELPDGYWPYLKRHPSRRNDWLANAAMVTAPLFPVAITLGHLGRRAAASGTASNAPRARAALRIGYAIAIAVTAAAMAAWLLAYADLAWLVTNGDVLGAG